MSVLTGKKRNLLLGLLLIMMAVLGMACSSDESGGGGVLDKIITQNTLDNAKPTSSGDKLPAARASSIYGTVLEDKTDNRISGVRVSISGYPSAYSGSDGVYRISDIMMSGTEEITSGKSFELRASKNGYSSHSENIVVRNGANVKADIRISKQLGTVTGVIRNSDGPVAGARIYFDRKSAQTNSEGFYSVSDIPAVSVHIRIVIDSEEKYAENRTIKQGQQRLDFVLEDGSAHTGDTAIVSGLITDNVSGSLVDDMLVTISGYPSVVSGQDLSGSAPGGNPKGFYRISGVPAGNRVITVIDPAVPPLYHDYYDEIDLAPEQNTRNIQLTPISGSSPVKGHIQGTVSNESGQLVDDVSVTVYRKNTLTGPSGDPSNSLGWFYVQNIPVGSWTITASLDDYKYLGLVDIIAGTTEVNITLELLE